MLRNEGPFIWVTWLIKPLTGAESCAWCYWFKSQFDSKSWTKAERVNNLARWQVGHTDLLNQRAKALREEGCTVTREAQNHFTVKSEVATRAGKPDLIAKQGKMDTGTTLLLPDAAWQARFALPHHRPSPTPVAPIRHFRRHQQPRSTSDPPTKQGAQKQ